jgi:prepilin-type N-terminal cleavage/methylation domain-containing protein
MPVPDPDSPLRGLEVSLERTKLRGMLLHAASARAVVLRVETGFTLIELLVTLTILLTVVTTLTGALMSATNTEADQNNRFQTQVQARQALTKLTREIHCASLIQDGGGAALTSTPVDGLTLSLPDGCPTAAGSGGVTAKWCTVADGTLWDLYRSWVAAGQPLSCPGSNGVRWAYGLVSSTPFSLPTGTTPANSFQLVHVDLTANTRGVGQAGAYTLVDDVAALNSSRS